MVSACNNASRSGASLRRAAERVADKTFCSSDFSAPARTVEPCWLNISAAAARAASSSAVGAWKRPSRPAGMRNRRVGGSSTSSSCGNTSRTASRIRSAVRRPTPSRSAISSRVSPSAVAASIRASSSSLPAFSCRIFPTSVFGAPRDQTSTRRNPQRSSTSWPTAHSAPVSRRRPSRPLPSSAPPCPAPWSTPFCASTTSARIRGRATPCCA